MTHKHARIIQHPFADSLQGALLDSYQITRRAGQLHLTLNLRALERISSKLIERNRNIHECLQGNYIPAQLYFSGVSSLKGDNVLTDLAHLPASAVQRTINDMLSWKPPGKQDTFYLFLLHAKENLMFFTRQVSYKRFLRQSAPATLERDWSPPPPQPGRLVPQPAQMHKRFGGDPITINVNGRVHHHKLFIGGIEIQSKRRPEVDAVLNLGEHPSRWVKRDILHPGDRAETKGEDSQGMSLAEIREESNWVIGRLQKNQRVLVHCVAGMNRSSTICCAALILLEGLSAEAALERVREHHPWARPDSHHWLRLRWLAINKKE